MVYNERLMNEALHGNDDSFEELKYNAGAGDCEAQYFLAMYYAKTSGHLHDPDYHYWLKKSKANGYIPGVGKPQMNNDDDGMSLGFKMEHLYLASHIATLSSII